MVGPKQLQILTSQVLGQIQARTHTHTPASLTAARMASWHTQRATGLEQGMAVKALIGMYYDLVTRVGVDVEE